MPPFERVQRSVALLHDLIQASLQEYDTMQALSTCSSAFANIGYYSQTMLQGAADLIAKDPIGIGLQVGLLLASSFKQFLATASPLPSSPFAV